jgi:hypothetical protein
MGMAARARVRTGRVAVVTFAAALVSACAGLIDFDQFTGGPTTDAGGSVDAPSPSAVDAAATVDSGPEARVDAEVSDAAGPAYCGDATFCGEFERSSASLMGAWGSFIGDITLPAIVPSGGNRTDGGFLRISIPGGPVTGGALIKPFGQAKSVRISFALRVFDILPRNIDVSVVAFDPDKKTNVALFLLLDTSLGGPTISFVEQGIDNGSVTALNRLGQASAPLGEWNTFVVDLKQDVTPQRANVTLNGQPFVTDQALAVDIYQRIFTLTAGCGYAEAFDAGSAFDIDDFRLDVTPL